MNNDMNSEVIAQAYQTLGLEPGASLEEIKKEYRNLAQVFHPDKYEAGSSRQQWAQDKLIQINHAYELLNEFIAKYPDGIFPGGWKREGNSAGDAATAGDGINSDEPDDWREWEAGVASHDDMTLKEWEMRQQLRQKILKEERNENVKANLLRYSKIAAVLFVLMLWTGRVTSHQIQQASIETNWAALKDRQAYDRQHQGADIDGTVWSNWELERRFTDQDTQLLAESEAHSQMTQVTGWSTLFFSLAVLVFVAWGLGKRVISFKFKGEKDAQT